MTIQSPTKKFFIYELLNPLKKNKPFYVGKGKKHDSYCRFEDHWNPIKLQKDTNKHKSNTIKKILKNKQHIGVNIIIKTST